MDFQTYLAGAIATEPFLPEFERLVQELAAGAEFAPLSKYGLCACFEIESVPLAVACESYWFMLNWGVWRAELKAQCPLEGEVAGFRVVPRGLLGEIVAGIRPAAKIAFDDSELVDFFTVGGHEETARRALTAQVVRQLTGIAREDVPRLVVSGRLARIAWSYEPSKSSIQAAINALIGIRAALGAATPAEHDPR